MISCVLIVLTFRFSTKFFVLFFVAWANCVAKLLKMLKFKFLLN